MWLTGRIPICVLHIAYKYSSICVCICICVPHKHNLNPAKENRFQVHFLHTSFLCAALEVMPDLKAHMLCERKERNYYKNSCSFILNANKRQSRLASLPSPLHPCLLVCRRRVLCAGFFVVAPQCLHLNGGKNSNEKAHSWM